MTAPVRSRDGLVPVVRTVVRRGSAEALADAIRRDYIAGRLAVAPQHVERGYAAGAWWVRYPVREYVPLASIPRVSGRLERAARTVWAHAVTRALVRVAVACAVLTLSGRLVWWLWGDEITAGLRVLAVLAVVAALLAWLVGAIVARARRCPGAHCPPGFH